MRSAEEYEGILIIGNAEPSCRWRVEGSPWFFVSRHPSRRAHRPCSMLRSRRTGAQDTLGTAGVRVTAQSRFSTGGNAGNPLWCPLNARTWIENRFVSNKSGTREAALGVQS